MARRRSTHSRSTSPSREGRLLFVIAQGASYPLKLPLGSTRLPSGAEIVLDGNRVELRTGRAGATLNDVEVSGPAHLHPGDVFAQGDVEYLLLPSAPDDPKRPARVLDHSSWQVRVEEEVAAGAGSFGLLLGRSGAFDPAFLSAVLGDAARTTQVRFVSGTFGENSVEILILGDASATDAVREIISERAARDDETVRWGMSRFPANGATAEELWSVAADRLLALDSVQTFTLVWTDPSMSRLRAFADRWGRRGRLLFMGAEGVGRESLARIVRLAAEPGAPFIVHRGARFDPTRWSEDVVRASGGSLHLRRPEMLPPDVLKAFWQASSFRPSAGESTHETGFPEHRIMIPELALRPTDIGGIAEYVVHSVDAQLGRRRTSLRAESRALLQTVPTPENVRSLRNLVVRGALNSSGSELRPEHFQLGASESPYRGVRAKVRETERQEIETALYRTGWNVTEAAKEMELPRRTLVYRMARLGMTRPRRN